MSATNSLRIFAHRQLTSVPMSISWKNESAEMANMSAYSQNHISRIDLQVGPKGSVRLPDFE
jgi:hypothetical protein